MQHQGVGGGKWGVGGYKTNSKKKNVNCALAFLSASHSPPQAMQLWYVTGCVQDQGSTHIAEHIWWAVAWFCTTSQPTASTYLSKSSAIVAEWFMTWLFLCNRFIPPASNTAVTLSSLPPCSLQPSYTHPYITVEFRVIASKRESFASENLIRVLYLNTKYFWLLRLFPSRQTIFI